MDKIKEEKIKNQIFINNQIEIYKNEIENRKKEYQQIFLEMDIKHKENLKSIENNHNQKMKEIKNEREKDKIEYEKKINEL